MKQYIFPLLAFCLALWSCEDPEPPILPPNPVFPDVNFLQNGGFEDGVAKPVGHPFESDSIPALWESAVVGPTYEAAWISDTSLVGDHSIRLSCNWPDPAAQAYIEQKIPFSQVGKRVKLNLLYQARDIDGEGFGLEMQALSATPNDPALLIAGDTITINNSGWTAAGLQTAPIPEGTTEIMVRVFLLRSTTGKVFIDEVGLQVEE